MASAKITTLSFYKWMIRQNDDLFSLLSVPEGMDKTVLVNHILMESAPFEVVYSDPEVMQGLIGVWSDANQDRWQRWFDAWEEALEFNPMENFDRNEHEVIQNSGTDMDAKTQTRNLAGTDNRTANLSNAETRNLTDQNTKDLTTLDTKDLTTLDTKDLTTLDTKDLTTLDTKNYSDNETKNLSNERKVSAYDSNTYAPKELETQTGTDNISHTGTDTIKNTGTDTVKQTGTDTVKQTGTDTTTQTGTDTTTQTGTDTTLLTGTDNHSTSDTGTVTDSGSFTHGHKVERDARYHGNIGTTSLAKLLGDWEEVVEKWDVYAVITHQFLNEFCILVY